MSINWDAINWGTVPDWIAGVGTAGALWFAFAGWRIAVREQHEAAVEKREQAARERRAHAQQFTCYAGGTSTTTADDGRIRYGVTVYVLNNSQHTFTNIEVRATAHGPGGWSETGMVRWPRLTPNPNAVPEQREAAVLHEDTRERPLPMPTWTVEAWLTDKDGVRWRYQDARLATQQELEQAPKGRVSITGEWWRRRVARNRRPRAKGRIHQ